MKRIISILIALLLIFSANVAMAESNDITPAAYSGEVCVSAQPYASRSIFVIEGQYKEVYNCPVRKKHIYVTFNSSEGPSKVKVMLLTTGESAGIYGPKVVTINDTCTFDLTVAAKYDVVVMSDDPGKEGNCRFTITATS